MYQELHGLQGTAEMLGMALPGGSSFQTIRQTSVAVAFSGFLGDRHAGSTFLSDTRFEDLYPRGTEIANSRQISLVSAEELQEIADRLGVPEVLPEWLGANVLVRGISGFTQLPVGVRLQFYSPNKQEGPGLAEGAEVVLRVEAENLPCGNPGLVIQRRYGDSPGVVAAFRNFAVHLRGLVATVEKPGTIVEGDKVRVFVPQSLRMREAS